MSDDRPGFVFVVPPDCKVGEAEARAIIASSKLTGFADLTDETPVRVQTSAFVPPGVIYVMNPGASDDPTFDELWARDKFNARCRGF